MTFVADGEFAGADAQMAIRILELCSQFQALRHAVEGDPDPLVIAEKMRQIDLSLVDQAHAWLTKFIVERYAIERITLDTGRFRRPKIRDRKD